MNEKDLKITFEGYRLDGLTYILIPKDKYKLLTESKIHIVITDKADEQAEKTDI